MDTVHMCLHAVVFFDIYQIFAYVKIISSVEL